MVWAYGFVTNRQQGPDGMSIGVVRIDDVLEFNPSYADYKQAKNELELLQRQYELEQQALNAKSETQDEQLKTLALDSTLSDALTVDVYKRQVLVLVLLGTYGMVVQHKMLLKKQMHNLNKQKKLTWQLLMLYC